LATPESARPVVSVAVLVPCTAMVLPIASTRAFGSVTPTPSRPTAESRIFSLTPDDVVYFVLKISGISGVVGPMKLLVVTPLLPPSTQGVVAEAASAGAASASVAVAATPATPAAAVAKSRRRGKRFLVSRVASSVERVFSGMRDLHRQTGTRRVLSRESVAAGRGRAYCSLGTRRRAGG
jgi:type IV secretory pathway TrbL component